MPERLARTRRVALHGSLACPDGVPLFPLTSLGPGSMEAATSGACPHLCLVGARDAVSRGSRDKCRSASVAGSERLLDEARPRFRVARRSVALCAKAEKTWYELGAMLLRRSDSRD